MSLAPGFNAKSFAPILPAFSLADWLRRQRGPREIYALSVDQLWFSVAVAMGLLLAVWLIAGTDLVPYPEPVPLPNEHLLVL